MNSRAKIDENTLGRETLCFSRHCGSWGRRSRVSVSAFSCLDLAKLSTKTAQDCVQQELNLHFKIAKKWRIGTLLEDEMGKMRTRL